VTTHVVPQKLRKAPALTRPERRAADTDSWVKNHLAEIRESDARKKAHLKALREARDGADVVDKRRSSEVIPVAGSTARIKT
jgi:hypothetical protein